MGEVEAQAARRRDIKRKVVRGEDITNEEARILVEEVDRLRHEVSEWRSFETAEAAKKMDDLLGKKG